MSDPILVPFKAEHLLRFYNRDGVQFRNEPRQFLMLEQNSIAWTALLDGKILGCGGVTLSWVGVGMAWTAMAPEAANHMFWVTKVIRRFMRDIVRAFNLHRLEMVALVESERNQRWAEFLGFTREQNSIAQKYTSDQRGMYRYEWVKNG